MKLIILVAVALAAVAVAAPPEPPQIIRSEYEKQPEGSYNYAFETENGIVREEVGTIKEALDEDNKPHSVIITRGSYSYIDDEGVTQTINYFADETGFHAEGPSIPKVPSRR